MITKLIASKIVFVKRFFVIILAAMVSVCVSLDRLNSETGSESREGVVRRNSCPKPTSIPSKWTRRVWVANCC